MKPTHEERTNTRVLVIDDNPAIHDDMQKILCPERFGEEASMNALEVELFDSPSKPPQPPRRFAVDHAFQGREGLELVTKAVVESRPYAAAFVDVRMPPGWDGVETTLELWKVARDLQVVICTAYADYSWEELLARLGHSDQFVILKKPFDAIEVLQLATALTAKWSLFQQTRTHAAELERRVQERTIELESVNASLHEEIRRRSLIEIELKRAKDSAESADRTKSAFLSIMNHEIRTPMNGILGMANLLLATPLDIEQRDLVATLCQSGESLLRIINDILDFSKIEAGRLVLESVDFDLVEHLALAVDLHAAAAAQKGLELVLDIDPDVPAWLRGDPVRLRQIVLNLIDNAIQFTLRGEVVLKVSLAGTREAQTLIRFEVSDSGIGIDPSVQAALFQPFVQADSSTSRRFGGTGLGLAICKRLAGLMRGEIGVGSSGPSGSSFWFTVDFDSPLDPAPEPALAPAGFERHHALIVDDNGTSRSLLARLCAHWRLRHAVADSGRAALDALHRAAATDTPFDLVLLDQTMPGVDGLGVAASILADAGIPRPTFVLLGSRGERLPPAKLDAAGFAVCELKPIHPEKLRATLARVLDLEHPPARSEIADAHVVPTPFPQAAHAVILIAEDDVVNQKVMLLQLRILGYAGDLAKNGREAIEALRRRPYALVLMAADMVGMDGIEATCHIRRAEAESEPGFSGHLPIIALAASEASEDREACLAAGMDGVLVKPAGLEDLRELLARHLSPAKPSMPQLPTNGS